jgi:hypothetical protein
MARRIADEERTVARRTAGTGDAAMDAALAKVGVTVS